MAHLRDIPGLLLLTLSSALLIGSVLSYSLRWDAVSALTIMPFWLVALPGLLFATVSRWIFGHLAAFKVLLLWLIATLIFSEETRTLTQLSGRAPNPGPVQPLNKRPALRVATLNCKLEHSRVKAESLARYQPDIVFIQELPSSGFANSLKQALYGSGGSLAIKFPCAIIARGKLDQSVSSVGMRDLFCRLQLDNGIEIQLANLHLTSSTTRLDLWNTEAWEDYEQVRKNHRKELQTTLKTLESCLDGQDLPIILGGDFNAAPSDPIFDALKGRFKNSYREAGRGIGHTYPSRFPILTLDHIYTNDHLIAGRSGPLRIEGTDHLMLVSDFRFKADD